MCTVLMFVYESSKKNLFFIIGLVSISDAKLNTCAFQLHDHNYDSIRVIYIAQNI